ncbi:hypothetical protein BU15DRAFT_80004 [Melanogaster broomeanus]|nr:hypothetical protein BU15DRAFT_80004 [Melanogaster broomeanus]
MFNLSSLGAISNTSTQSVDLAPTSLVTISGHEDSIFGIVYLPGGERLVTCSYDKTVRIWNVESGEQEGTSMAHNHRVACLAVTRDGKRILSGGDDKIIRVWDVETHDCIEDWGGNRGAIECIAVSPDDRLVASGDREGQINIRDMKEGGRVKNSILLKSGILRSVCFSPNGEKLACGSYNNNGIRVFDVARGELVLGPIEGHGGDVSCVIWSLDGSQLFSASHDYTIRCWNSETGDQIGKPWTWHSDWVHSLSLSPDGTKIASSSWDKTVCFWDAHSGDPIGQPLQHETWVTAVTFSPSGEFVASGGRGYKVSIWRVPWRDDQQIQAYESLLDLPAVPPPNVLSDYQEEADLHFSAWNDSQRSLTYTLEDTLQALIEPEQRREEKKRAMARSDLSSKFSHTFTSRQPLHQQGSQSDLRKAAFSASLDADHTNPERVGDSHIDLEDVLPWEEWRKGFYRRRMDHVAAVTRRKADHEAERDGVAFEMKMKELQSSGYEPPQPQDLQMYIGSPKVEAGPSSSDHTTTERAGNSQVGMTDPQRVILQSQEQPGQFGPQLDDEAAAKCKTEAEAEKDTVAFEIKIKQLQSSGDESHQSPEPPMHVGSPNAEAGPSSPDHTTAERAGDSQVCATDPQRVILQLQEQPGQFGRQLDDEGAVRCKTEVEAEKAFEMKIKQLQSSGDESHQPQMRIGSPNVEAGPSSSNHTTPAHVGDSQVRAAEPQRINMFWQEKLEQLEQLRRQLDDEAAARRELEMELDELQCTDGGSPSPLEPETHTSMDILCHSQRRLIKVYHHSLGSSNAEAGPSPSHPKPSCSASEAVPSTSQACDTKIASSAYDDIIRFGDTHSGHPIRQPVPHESRPYPVALSLSGGFMASGEFDETVPTWPVPWRGDRQKQVIATLTYAPTPSSLCSLLQAYESLLDPSAASPPKDLSNLQEQGELNLLDLPATRLIISSSHTATTITRHVQRLWNRLTAPRSDPSTTLQAAELQPIRRQHRFWGSLGRIPVTQATQSTSRVAVGGKPQQSQKCADTSQTRLPARPSAEPSTSASKPGPSHPAGTPPNPAPAGLTSSYVPSTAASDDTLDNLDNCGKCLDYFCGHGPRANRETFRPWRKKSRALIEAEQRVKEERRRAKARRDRWTEPGRKAASPASPDADHPTPELVGDSQVGGADPRRLILQQQEQIEQLRRQRDDEAAGRRKAEAQVAERDQVAFEMKIKELQSSSDRPPQPQDPQMHIVTQLGSPNGEAGPSPPDHTTPECLGDSQVGMAGPQRLILQLQLQIEQLRRQLDDEASTRRKAEAEAERDQVTPKMKIKELHSSGDEPPEPQTHIGPPNTEADPSSSGYTTPERARRKAGAEAERAFEMTIKELQSSSDRPPQPQDSQMHIVTQLGSPNGEAGPSPPDHATTERLGGSQDGAADPQRVVLQLLEQFRRRLDDEAAARRELEMKVNERLRTDNESRRPLQPQTHTGTDIFCAIHTTQ